MMSYWVKLSARLVTKGNSLNSSTPSTKGSTKRKPRRLFSYPAYLASQPPSTATV